MGVDAGMKRQLGGSKSAGNPGVTAQDRACEDLDPYTLVQSLYNTHTSQKKSVSHLTKSAPKRSSQVNS